MRIPIKFSRKPEQQSCDHKTNDAFFFRGQDEFVPQLCPGPSVRQVQFNWSFNRGRTLTDG